VIAIINYGMGNLRSVLNAFRAVEIEARIIDHPSELAKASGIVLPGVGAFGDGMQHVRALGFDEGLEREVRERGKPFLGLCLGMQMLAGTGLEHGVYSGLGWVEGTVERLPNHSPVGSALRVPHIGWSAVRTAPGSRLFAKMDMMPSFYFVHSYALRPSRPDVVTAWCEYGSEFAAAIEFENILATQFHPEKSQRAGLQLLANFSALIGRD
jgi:glutamine amidotransferase